MEFLTDKLARHAATKGDAVALEWWEGDRDEAVRRLTFAELHRLAGRAAAALEARTLRGERVVLAFAPGLEFVIAFVACLQAGVVAVPAPLPMNRRTLERTRAIVADCRPALGLTGAASLGGVLQRLGAAGTGPEGCGWLAWEELAGASAEGAVTERPTPRADDLAYLQYTSGSGGSAKGVMITHANLAHNHAVLEAVGPQPPTRPMLSWLPHYHDMQLVVMLTRGLAVGAPGILMAPADFLQRPVRWLRAVARSGAYISGGPNFAYEHCLRKVTSGELAGLDFSGWKIAFNSSEHIRPATLERFERLLAPGGFSPQAWYPAYGLAEATAFVTGVALDEPPRCAAHPGSGQPVVCCGRTVLGDQVAIVDPTDGRRCRGGEIGEICVCGASVAPGYWNRPAENAALFYPRLPLAGSGETGPFLRTGDLGFVDGEGGLYFTGRIKDLLVVRGTKHACEDIEASLDGCHPALRGGELAAFAIEDPAEDREQLVVVAELERTARHDPDVPAIAEALQVAVSRAHELVLDHLVLLRPGGLPKTTSGKLQRAVCRRLFLDGEFPAIANWHRREGWTPGGAAPAPANSCNENARS